MSDKRNSDPDPNRQVVPSSREHAFAILRKFRPKSASQLITERLNTDLPSLLTIANSVLNEQNSDPMETFALTRATLDGWVLEFHEELKQQQKDREPGDKNGKGRPQLPRLRFRDLQNSDDRRFFSISHFETRFSF